MSESGVRYITDLSQEELLRVAGIYLGEVFVHYGMWFSETCLRHGIEEAIEFEPRVMDRYGPLLIKRLAPHLGIELEGDVPKVMLSKSREELLLLIADIAKTWVAGDGVWFQAVEAPHGMAEAKLVNDACWSKFAWLEAARIKRVLGIEKQGGLAGLDRALRLRLYSSINAHESKWDADGNLEFRMTECRVQSARRRKGMEDYPCKSGGFIEYTEFAKSIDSRIVCECVYCPPDRMPDEQFCWWRFKIV
jgi:hypothetical protein